MKHLIYALFAFVLPISGWSQGAGSLLGGPNIVVILVDDLGYGDVGTYGAKLNKTPCIDQMARDGMKLTSFYAAPHSSAGQAQFMTGCYAKRVGNPGVLLPSSGVGLNTNKVTLPKLLQSLGYFSMCIGNWNLGATSTFSPASQGFDCFLGAPFSDNTNADDLALAGSDGTGPEAFMPGAQVIKDPAAPEVLTHRFTDAAVKFITENQSRPFFLYMPYSVPNYCLHSTRDLNEQSKNRNYRNWIEEVDYSVGSVIETLRKLKLDQTTLVILVSNNGATGINGASNAPLRGFKGSTWEGGVRVPAIALWTGRIPAGSSSDALTSSMDLLPTLVNLASGKDLQLPKIDGMDIWSILSDRGQRKPREALYYFLDGKLQAVRAGPWKLVIAPQRIARNAEDSEGLNPKSAEIGEKNNTKDKGYLAASLFVPRLYDLDRDIGESTDVAAGNPEVVNKLLGLVRKIDADLGVSSEPRPNFAPDVRPGGGELSIRSFYTQVEGG